MVSVTLSEKGTTKTQFKFGYELKENKAPQPNENQSLVKIQATSFNHR